MLFSIFDLLYVLLTAIVLVRVFLNQANFTALVIVCFASFLSFAFFESLWSLSPLVWYFLRKYLLPLFTWIKTFFFKVEKCFFSGNQEQEKDTVLSIQGKEENLSIPKESPISIGTQGQSGNSPTFKTFSSHTFGSPLEETFERSRYVVWIGSGLCASILFTTIQIVWVILRKLDYTQDLVNKMIGKGVPKFLLFWIRHPNPGPVGGKPLFVLMVTVLVGNVIVLYILINMVYLVS